MNLTSLLTAVWPIITRPATPAPATTPIHTGGLATENVIGKELHVMYHFIIPTEPFANVRMIAGQTVRYAPGSGITLEARQAAMVREAQGLRNLMLNEAEVLRRDLTSRAFTVPNVQTSTRRTSRVEAR